MKPLPTPEEMGEADRRTIAAGTPVDVLMDRAGRAVAWRVRRTCGGVYGRRAVVVCGKGNNGGDGLVAADVLRGWGVRVETFSLEDGIDRPRFVRALARADVVIDAMYGTGFSGTLDGDAAWAADATATAGATVVAVDIPSGVDGLTGAAGGPTVRAHHTVTFAARKPGLVFEPGRSRAGTVTVAAIGIDVEPVQAHLTEAADVAAWLPGRSPSTHKWEVGAVMVVGGTTGMTGAPMFVSHAAMRAGAGIVWCGVPGEPAAAAASGTEVITIGLPTTPAGSLDVGAATAVSDELDRFGALVIGPGLGRGEFVPTVVDRLVATTALPIVLDADGLNALHGDLSPLRTRSHAAVITPHDGEYARLVGAPPGPDRIAAAKQLADASNSVVLLKGSATVIAEPGAKGRVAVNLTGGPWLASAGTGDVLSGIVGAFLARGMGPFEAAAAGAWVHGRAADRAGHTGMIAGDLIAAIPAALPEPATAPAPDPPRTRPARTRLSRTRLSRTGPGGLMAASTPVTEVMTKDVISLSPETSLPEAADLLAEKGIGAAPVVDADGRIVGLLRDEDLLISEARLHLPTTFAILPGIDITLPGSVRRYDEELKKAASSTVADVMERKFKQVGRDATVEDVATLMHEHDVTHIPVVDGDAVVGIVARGDIVRFLAATT